MTLNIFMMFYLNHRPFGGATDVPGIKIKLAKCHQSFTQAIASLIS